MDSKIRESLADVLNVAPDELTRDRVLNDLEGWDSVAVLSVMVVLGEGLGREIAPEDVVRLKTFGDIEDLAAAA